MISNVKYVHGLWVNLFSLSQPLKQGWRLSNEGFIMKIKKGPHIIVFDPIMDTDSGAITGESPVHLSSNSCFGTCCW
jgi:hypothetical protein